MMDRSTRLVSLGRLLLLAVACAANVSQAQSSGTVVVGDVRFTVITPNCIRIEQAPGAKFVDEPSLVAIHRDVKSGDYKLTQEGGATVIETAAMRLRYQPNGKPFSPQNLVVEITAEGAQSKQWSPGAKNASNLGGTARTLDGWDGAGDLGEGLLSRDGWFCLDDSKTPLFTNDWVRSRPADSGTDWYLFSYGNNYRAALQSFTAFGGKVPMPRRYVLGAWYSRYWPYTSDEYRAIVKEYADHDFPLDMLVLDMDWHKDGWTGYSWNRKLLPDAEGLLKWLHEQGLHVTLNDHPADGVAPHEDCYPEFMRAMDEDPSAKKTLPYDAGSKAYLTAHYDNLMQPLVKDGVDFWWLDWQQYPNTRSVPDLTNLFWLNHYYYQRTQTDGQRGQDLTRWGGWGSHRYPIQFSGDASTSWKMLAFEVPFTATAGNVGAFFWSHDIGGHQGGRNEESYTRWVQFGAMTTALRSHSTRSAEMDRRPWTYPKWAEDSMRTSFHLRSQLMPYIYSSVQQSCMGSFPLTAPMYLASRFEERAYHSPQQYLFGPALLVAPIAAPGVGPSRVATQVVWFPPGSDWYNYFTGERYEGGSEHLVAADINEFPLYVRGGSPIIIRPYTPRMTTDPLETAIIRVYPGGLESSNYLYEDDGETTAYQSVDIVDSEGQTIHRRGEFAITMLKCEMRQNRYSVQIEGTDGQYAGQLGERTYVVELPCTERATSAQLNGEPLAPNAISYDESTFTNRITLPKGSIRMYRRLQVTANPVDARALASRARARRTANGAPADVAEPRQQMLEAIQSLPADADPTPLLASFGIGVFEKNETPYRWPEEGILGLYAPEGLLDNDRISYNVGGYSTIFKIERDAALGRLAPLPALEQKPFPVEPTRALKGQVTLTIGKRALRLSCPEVPVDFNSNKRNIDPNAKATASTATRESPAGGVIDGRIGGYPQSRKEEWSSDKEKSGATLTLTWDSPQSIDRVWLFDRQNLDDQVTAGELVFDAGDPVKFGTLPNDASAGADVKFAARTTKSLTIRVTDVQPRTVNVGLSEVVVLKSGS